MSEFRGETYPDNYQFYDQSGREELRDGEIVGRAVAYLIIRGARDREYVLPDDVLVWFGGYVGQMSAKRYNRKIERGEIKRLDNNLVPEEEIKIIEQDPALNDKKRSKKNLQSGVEAVIFRKKRKKNLKINRKSKPMVQISAEKKKKRKTKQKRERQKQKNTRKPGQGVAARSVGFR